MTGFLIPNAVDSSTYPAQADLDSRDVTILTSAAQDTGVISGCAVTPNNNPIDTSLAVSSGSVKIAGVQIAVAAQVINASAVAPSGSQPRFGLVMVDTTGTVSITLGTATPTPAFPTYSSTDHVVLYAVYLPTSSPTVSGTNLIDKRVFLSDPAQTAQNEWTKGLGLFAAQQTVRKTWAAFGGPGGAGGTITNSSSYTLLDTSDPSNGGVGALTSAPGVLHAINIFIAPSQAWPWKEETGIEIYYDGQTVPAIRMPFRNWANVNGCSFNASSTITSFRHRFVDFHALGPSNGGQHQVSFSFKVPMPFSTSIKVVLVTPGVGTAQLWTLCDYTVGSNYGFGSAKLRTQWWSRSAWTSPQATYSQLGDVATSDAGGKYVVPTTYSTSEAAPASAITGATDVDSGWGTRLATGIDASPSTVSLSVFNATALIRGLEAGGSTPRVDPLTGTAIGYTNTAGVISAITPNLYAWLGNECIQITGINLNTNTLTVVRAVADPITGASTTIAAHNGSAGTWLTSGGHPGDNITRILGPVRVVGCMIGNSDNNQLEGPVGIFLDKEVGWDWSSGGKGLIGSVGSGGTEDFFGAGWYGSLASIAAGTGGFIGMVTDPDRFLNSQISFGSGQPQLKNWTRWFHNDPLFGQYGVQFRWQSCEIGNAGVQPYPGSTTLFVYTSH